MIKPGSHIVVTGIVTIGNCKQVQANSERNLSQFLHIIFSLYACICLPLPTVTISVNMKSACSCHRG